MERCGNYREELTIKFWELKGLKKKQNVQLSNIFHKRVEFWCKKKINFTFQRPYLHLASFDSFESFMNDPSKRSHFCQIDCR